MNNHCESGSAEPDADCLGGGGSVLDPHTGFGVPPAGFVTYSAATVTLTSSPGG